MDLLLKYGDFLLRARAAAGSWEFVGWKLEQDVAAIERRRLPQLAKHFGDTRYE
ncbi:hypothetical protein [Candidatus Burkholderia verschuerenii]|uniref:hypothetical protein n=1 Tax=Candidatus Burkholderia verschuerenii TaxID=242163 RepID=UPI0012ED64E8|nr:hypothetical protein [Candidatus Burkholderia verschuerenii]